MSSIIDFLLTSNVMILDTLTVSLSHYLGPLPPMHPDSVPDLGAI